MTPPRVLAVVLVATLTLTVAAVTLREAAEQLTATDAAPDRTHALAVLRSWDRRRAAAWHAGNPRALDRLYVQGAAAGRVDRVALAAYAARGLRVTGMRMQVAGAEVRSETGRRIVLLVTDRLVGAVAVGRGRRVALPADRWSRRRVELVLVGESWRVSEVVDQPRPVASTDSTSGSENS